MEFNVFLNFLLLIIRYDKYNYNFIIYFDYTR